MQTCLKQMKKKKKENLREEGFSEEINNIKKNHKGF
jgi:hypothetical protein